MRDPRPAAPGQPEPERAVLEGVEGTRAAPTTSDARVDQVLAELATVLDRPLAQQVGAYVGAHQALQDRLADLDD